MVCRPLELTTWATLVNFMHFNKLAPQTLVTNMGFVDFTPKKQIILEDAIQQIEAVMGQDIATFDFAENYVLSNGESVPLYSMKYRDAYKEKIEEIVEKQRTFIINTPLVDADICIERERPNSFFSGVADTSEFNRSIKGACVVDFPKIDESFTYDAVHYTKLGSDLIFRIIKESL